MAFFVLCFVSWFPLLLKWAHSSSPGHVGSTVTLWIQVKISIFVAPLIPVVARVLD
jgi:hypothetical protein